MLAVMFGAMQAHAANQVPSNDALVGAFLAEDRGSQSVFETECRAHRRD
jgi:hypothetical protein